MAKKYTRKEILDRLRREVAGGKPILMFGAGIGLTAKSAELGGADLIAVYSTAISRMRGLPTLLAFLPYSDANEDVRRMAREILPAVKEAPCIVGIGAHDPTLDLGKFISEMVEMGFSGITNEPFAGIYGPEFAAQLESAGIGFSKEAELIRTAHASDIFTVAWAFTPQEAAKMAEAGADVVGALVGVTAGGLTGVKKALSLEEAAEAAQAMSSAAKKVNPDVLVLTHGGPFKDPETAEYSLVHTDAVGYAAGSSGERMPTEKAVSEVTRRYKAIKMEKTK
ncbi:MAG: phosphoenolpyruvate hydrolase family protein [Spirochaetes bacterium]|nr:phosphoenolpyruvate hydrolase family protein [Spirochaetota bacterium]